MHQRQVIRNSVVTLLSGKTSAGANVFPSKFTPTEKAALPCINIYTKSETSSEYQAAPRQEERKLELSIEIQARGVTGLDDILDSISEQVESVMRQDDTLGDVCGDCVYSGAEISISDDGDALIGSCVMTYEVYYYSYAVADKIEANGYGDFEGAGITWRQPSTPDTQDDANDIIDLPQ